MTLLEKQTEALIENDLGRMLYEHSPIHVIKPIQMTQLVLANKTLPELLQAVRDQTGEDELALEGMAKAQTHWNAEYLRLREILAAVT